MAGIFEYWSASERILKLREIDLKSEALTEPAYGGHYATDRSV